MHIDRERQARLEREKAEAEAEIQRLDANVASTANGVLPALRDRIRAIDEELNRMEFATEMERQSDA